MSSVPRTGGEQESAPPVIHGLARIDPDARVMLPALVEHAQKIKQMDDEHADQYLWAGSKTTSWISPWQASELKVVMMAAELAGITKEDVVMDLGCGDGRVNLALAKAIGCKGYGWDSSDVCIETADMLARTSGLDELVTFRVLDFTKAINQSELDESTVLFAYLPVLGLQKIRDLLIEAMRKNTAVRLITNEYHFPDTENWIILAEKGPLRVSRPRLSRN